MAVATDDTRHFETAVDLSPEEATQNLDYFREQGSQADYEPDPDAPVQPSAEVKPPETESQPVDTKVGDNADSDVDADLPADGQAPPDGEHLGWRARKTKQIKDLEGKLQTTTAEKDGQIAELRRQLEARNRSSSAPTAPVSPLAPTPSPAITVQKEEPKPEVIKPKEFEKPRPVAPKFADFASADDPIAAHADAVAEHADKLSDWKDEKREFDTQQKAEVEKQTRQQTQTREQQTEKEREIGERYQAASTAHPDFVELTNRTKYNPVLTYLLREQLTDGFELGYELAKPENAQVLADIVKSSQTATGESTRSIENKIYQATSDLAIFRHSLKTKPPSASAPVADAPPVVEEQPTPTPPKTAPPRREEAAPTQVRSRGAAAQRLEDIPAENYDERRKWREANGQL